MENTNIDIEHCTVDDIGLDVTGEGAAPIVAVLNEYLSTFAKPASSGTPGMIVGSSRCLKCDTVLDGFIGSFTWGMANGEGTCSKCGWPARALHRPEDDEGPIFNRALEKILQYHPDNVEAAK